MTGEIYDGQVSADNKYGHALDLLAERLGAENRDRVHLDLACGFGRIAEWLVKLHGVHYVGVDISDLRVQALKERGFEAHVGDLEADDVANFLDKVLDGRRLASITFLDGLEHITNGARVLEAIGTLLARERAIGVLSVPNVTHLDIGIKALLGSWDYTDAGLLDGAHLRLYGRSSLTAALGEAGLTPIGEANVLIAQSDQHFPKDHVALSDSSSVGQWLRYLRSIAEPSGLVNQFVWAVAPVPPVLRIVEREVQPFLSIVMRTQGRREQELREALLCVAGQTDLDFELLVVAHRTTVSEQIAIERILEDQPATVRHRTRLLLLDHGGRSAPLNLALTEARGSYVGVFDDDDLVLGHWVEEFHKEFQKRPGRVLRSLTLRQDASIAEVRGFPGVRAEGAPTKAWSTEFSLLEHLICNQSPTMGWVYPRSLHSHFGLHYDETMTTTEDWDVLLRASELAGVSQVNAVTGLYHFWSDRESSATLHSQAEWTANQHEIERRLDSRPFLVPPGETRELRRALLHMQEVERAMIEQDQRTQQQAVNMNVERLEFARKSERWSKRLARKNASLADLREQNQQLRRRLGAPPAGQGHQQFGRRNLNPRRRMLATLLQGQLDRFRLIARSRRYIRRP